MVLRAAIQCAITFGLSYILVPLTVPLCRVTGALDVPDGVRKINTHPIPRLGGLGIYTAIVPVLLPLCLTSPTVGATLAAGGVLAICGVCDDTYGMPWQGKLISQIAAALCAIVISGIPSNISLLGIFDLPVSGPLGFLFVLVRLVFTMNAVNFSDGLDGLAAGICTVALTCLSVYGAHNGKLTEGIAALIIAAAVVGFMPYNRYRARIFMGDTGSQFLGLAIAMLSLGTSRGGSFTLETSMFLAVPTLDTAAAVIRRIIKRKSPFSADKGHLHHLLLSIGVPHPDASHLLVALSALIALVTLFGILNG